MNRTREATLELIVQKISESKTEMLDRMKTFENITTTALNNLQDDMRETKVQTQKTNGRVTGLESEVQKQDTANQVFRARVYTAVAIIVFVLGSMIIPIVGAYISR